MNQFRKVSSLLALFVAAAPLLAHEGHGVGAGHELWHFFGSPGHILPVAIVIALTIAFLLFRKSRRAGTEEEYAKKD